MSQNGQQESKKGFSGNFLLFLLSIVLLVTMLQNFMQTKVAKVGFSYQLEHLENLELIVSEESRKIALNDNLVSFSGKFRDERPPSGKQRFKYLSLLNTHHELENERESLEESLQGLKGKILDASDWFLHLSGEAIPKEGFRIIGHQFDTATRESHVTLNERVRRSVMGLPVFRQKLQQASGKSQQSLQELGMVASEVVRNFQSPILGIGDRSVKETLKSVERETNQLQLQSETVSPEELLERYEEVYAKLEGVSALLQRSEEGIRLSALRSVRDYKNDLMDYTLILLDLDENSAQLEKARDAETVKGHIWFFNNQELSTNALEKQDYESYHPWFLNAKKEWENFDANRGAFFRAPDQPLNIVLEKRFRSEQPQPNYLSYLLTVLPILLVLLVLYFVFSRQMKGMGNSAMNFGKSPAKLQSGGTQVTFKDVAGAEEAIEELYEVVDFLKNPEKFTALGGTIPKGVLCVGPPGTGKTLIARAVAGEANRPFFTISGSDFVEMFVGVGASRIRDLFDQAKKQAPCIVFIDEIDAVGRHRGAGIGGGHDEREQTLNQLLVEMDGFDANEGVILMAATNRPDVLDKALLRPGRFDRRVILELPDIKGRFDILKVHARKIKLDESVDLMAIARGTPGASGADLKNILNESALLAARAGRSAVTNAEAIAAREKVLYGKERRSLEVNEDEKKNTAYHESGHAVVGMVVKGGDPVEKVTIIPRGHSLGATHFLPEKNKVGYWKKELKDRLAVLMGGRAAEEIFLDDFSSGAQQDIQQATQLARSMVCQWGMSDAVGVVAYDERAEGGQYLGMTQYHERTYSEKTAQAIDQEVRRLVNEAYEMAKSILLEYREQVEEMTAALIEFESIDRTDCLEIVIEKTFDPEKKREREKKMAEAHKQPTKTPPPIPPEESSDPRDHGGEAPSPDPSPA